MALHNDATEKNGVQPAQRPQRSLLFVRQCREGVKNQGEIRKPEVSNFEVRDTCISDGQRTTGENVSGPDVIDKLEFLGQWLQTATAFSGHEDENCLGVPSSMNLMQRRSNNNARMATKRRPVRCRRLCIPPTILEQPSSCESSASDKVFDLAGHELFTDLNRPISSSSIGTLVPPASLNMGSMAGACK
jgi:hypothetical protein